jgi:hypothetical protein
MDWRNAKWMNDCQCCQWTAIQQATCLNVRPAVCSVGSMLLFSADLNVFASLEWKINYLPGYSVRRGSYWQANLFSASQEIPRSLWHQKVCYHIHKCLSPFHTFSQINPLHSPSHFHVILLNIILLSLHGYQVVSCPQYSMWKPFLAHFPST